MTADICAGQLVRTLSLDVNTQVVQIYTVEDYFEGRRPALPVAA